MFTTTEPLREATRAHEAEAELLRWWAEQNRASGDEA